MGTARRAGLLLAALCLLAGCRGRPEAGDEVWAEVNGQPIYRAQVEKFYAQRTANFP